MSWDRKLKPIALNDGRNIATLADARELLLALPDRQQRNSQWQYAAELLLYAADHGDPTADARNQLNRVLTSAGLIRRPQLRTNLLRSRMPWTAQFSRPIELKDGRTLVTLGKARFYLLSLPAANQDEPHWVDTMTLLLRASEFPNAIDEALAVMLIALKAEGLI